MLSVLKSFPLLGAVPGRVESMEAASNDLWRALRKVSVLELKSLKPTPEFKPLVDALIDIRLLMGEYRSGVAMTEHP